METDPSGLEFRAGYVRAVRGEEPLLGFEELLDITQPGNLPLTPDKIRRLIREAGRADS